MTRQRCKLLAGLVALLPVPIMKISFLILACAGTLRAAIPATYSAADANPSPAWNSLETSLGSDSSPMDGLIDTGANVGPVVDAWQIHDQLVDPALDNPEYSMDFSTIEQDELINNGWLLVVRVRATAQNNGTPFAGFLGWGLGPQMDGMDRRAGFYLKRSGTAFQVAVNSPTGNSLTLAPSTADDFHTLVVRGIPGTQNFDVFVDGIPLPAGTQSMSSVSPVNDLTGGKVVWTAGTSGNSGGAFDIASLSLGLLPPRIYVDSANGSPSSPYDSWSTAASTLQNALALVASGQEIWVAEGTYYPDEGAGQVDNARSSTFTIIDAIGVQGGFPGGGGAQDQDAYPTILSGDIGTTGATFDNAYHVVTASNSATTATVLNGLTITEGNANGAFPDDRGAGLLMPSASLSINNCTFTGNRATVGGAIYSASFPATIFTNCSFAGNIADESGGAIYNVSALTLTNCTFTGNIAQIDFENQGGGALYNDSSFAPVILTNCTFTGNIAENEDTNSGGGAIHNFESSPTLIACSFHGNTAPYGGAIFNETDSEPVFTGCTFTGNSAQEWGGAIYNNTESYPTFVGCSFRGNESLILGGGIYNASFSEPVFTNCSFSGNAGTRGGGIYNNQASPTLINCSLAGNDAATDGGGIYSINTTTSLTNCLIWSNRDDSGIGTGKSSVAQLGSVLTFSYCLVQGRNFAGPGNIDGTDPLNDPRFVLPADASTAPTTAGDLRLLTGSPALDAGDGISGVSTNTTTTDLAGNPRFVGTIDLGAYEGNVDATFVLLYPSLLKTDDDNGNGHTNYEDYAVGANPLAPHNPFLYPSLVGNQLILGYRNNASDVFVEFQKSPDLNIWDVMIEGIGNDYTINTTSSSGGRTELILDLLIGPPTYPQLFFREEFFETAP